MAMNHLTTFVPKKLDVDAMNYSSWVYYVSYLCHGYGILDHLVDPVASSSTATPTDPPPKDAEWTRIDFIIRVQNPLVDATSASPMVLLAKSNISARRVPSLEKVNNPCWSFARDLVGLVMLVSIFTMVFTGSQLWSLVPLVQLLVWWMGSIIHSRISGLPQGVHLVPRPLQLLVQFTTGVQQQQAPVHTPQVDVPTPPTPLTPPPPPTPHRYKAHLVANGSTQVEGVDVDETISSVVKLGTIWTILSLAISRHWPVDQLDVKNAFSHGTSRLFQRFAAYITTVGFTPSRFDSSLFIYKQDDNTTFLLLYVDDIGLTASSDHLLQYIIAFLHREFSMTDLGKLNYFLGISVMRDSSGMFLSQCKYAMVILERAHMVGCNPSWTPVDTESKLGDGGTSVIDPTLYRSLAGSLYYLTFTRPDITYVVQQVCLYMHDPQIFSSTNASLIAYSDADWAGCLTTRWSNSGYCVFLWQQLTLMVL
nr:ribonuclease H-like domain-containing protein [Tanacetum cinerariifolium]